MKTKLIKLLDTVGLLLSFIYSESVTSFLCSIRNRIFTGFIRRRFEKLGNSVFIWHPYTLMGLNYIRIGDGNIFEKDIQLATRKVDGESPKIEIGNNCLIRRGAHITAVNSIVIGNNLLTGTNVLITDNSHGDTDYFSLCLPPDERAIISNGKITIGNNVWLGNNVCVMPGVIIGDGVVVGANSVVTHDIPPYSIAVGAPAKVINIKSN